MLTQLVALFVFTGLASVGYSYLVADTFSKNDAPPGHFPLVAATPRPSPDRYRLVRWSERETASSEGWTFRLPEIGGRFTLESIGQVTPIVSFQVLEQRDGRQRIEVTWSDDDYQRQSRYLTDGAQVEPEYFRIWGASMAFIGIVPGILAAWLLGVALRRIARGWAKAS